MTSKSVIPVMFNRITEKASEDEADVLYQVDAVAAALEQLGYEVLRYPFPENPAEMPEELKRLRPLLVFNLVEAVSGQGRLSYLAPSILEALRVKYTGCPAEAIFLTTNKLVTKKLLNSCGILTPAWVTIREGNGFQKGDRYIIKTIYEDGSIGLYHDSIVTAESVFQIRELLGSAHKKTSREYFAERYIDGREINISMLEVNGRPLVLPPGEIKFIGYKERNLAEIFDYRAKWEEGSFEYKNTVISNSFDSRDDALLRELERISVKCWWEFGLKGYARVDFRIDSEGKPWVLEINANPCITPGGSSFIRSAMQGGLDYKSVVEKIILEAMA